MNSYGVLQEEVDASSPDGSVHVHIPSGTEVLGPTGAPIDDFTVTPVDPLPDPPEGGHVLAAFDIDPDGMTFNPGIEITITFDPSEVAAGEEVVIGVLNEVTGEWEYATGIVNANGTATFTITHTTIYGVLAVPEGTVPTPAPAQAGEDEGIDWWVWVVVGVMILVILVLVIAIIVRVAGKGGKKSRRGKRSRRQPGTEDDFEV